MRIVRTARSLGEDHLNPDGDRERHSAPVSCAGDTDEAGTLGPGVRKVLRQARQQRHERTEDRGGSASVTGSGDQATAL